MGSWAIRWELWLITTAEAARKLRAIALDPNLAAAYLVRSLLKRDLLDDVSGASSDYDFPSGTLRDRAIAIDPQII
jgi:hypothetical protein